jgi:hypothetical protein
MTGHSEGPAREVLHLYDLNDGVKTYLIAAPNPEVALREGRTEWGVGVVFDSDEEIVASEVTVRALPDDRVVTISLPDDPPGPLDVPAGGRVEGDCVIATAGQWAAHVGSGIMVGSSEWE